MESQENTNVQVEESVQGQNSQQKEGQVQEKTFTQEDVNNLVARESKKATEKLLKELGVEDFKSAKEGIVKLKEYQEAQKSDAEKQADELNRLKGLEQSQKAQINTLTATISALKIGVRSEAVDDVILLAQKAVTNELTIDEAIKKVIEKYPQFKEGTKEEQKAKQVQFVNGKNNVSSGTETDLVSQVLSKYKR